MKSSITLDEIMKRKYFNRAEIVAGNYGTQHQVRWVHCLEVTKINNLLNGNELILTTGLGWKDDESEFIIFLQQLIDCHAAGLCIEMGTHINNIPQPVLNLANHHHFPIILFHQEVPFVEITHDIHALIINKQYELISNLETYSQQLNKKLLEIDHVDEILKFLYDYLDVQVILTFHNEIRCIPELRKKERDELMSQIEETEGFSPRSLLKQSIQIMGEQYANLLILSMDRVFTDFDTLILDRTATALAQHLLRDLYIEEKRMTDESKWLTNWLKGDYSEEAIKEQLSFIDPSLKLHGGVVFVCKQFSYVKLDGTYFKLLFRTVFEQYGFQLFPVENGHQLIFILGDKRDSVNWRKRVEEAFKKIKKADAFGSKRLELMSIGVGKYVCELSVISESYETAKETLILQEKLAKENQSYFYQDLHMYRMLSLINMHSNLKETVYEYLSPVIEFDKKFNGELMPTLKAYLACNGSKQETSKKLFIVRQTLYHRLEKLEKLLGDDFMNSDKRFGIEFMVFAYEYLAMDKSSKQTGRVALNDTL